MNGNQIVRDYKRQSRKLLDIKNVPQNISDFLTVMNERGVRNKDNAYVCDITNCFLILAEHPYLKNRLGYSTFDECIMVTRPFPSFNGYAAPNTSGGAAYPRRITDADIDWLKLILKHSLPDLIGDFKDRTIEGSVSNVAFQNTYNPVHEYLNSITWDGTPRIHEWIHKAFGAENNDLNSTIGIKFLVGAIRRACARDGHKFDSMLVLEGAQNIQKSTMCRILFGIDGGKYFMEGIGDIKSAKLYESLSGKWGIEIPELKGFSNHDSEVQKEFLSKVSDTIRRPYLRHPGTYPRRCVFIGTVNENNTNYIKEKGTHRRFWPVKCGETNPDWLREFRDQLWGEAYQMAQSPMIDYFTKEELDDLGVIQEDRISSEPWEEIIIGRINACNLPTDASMSYYLTDVLNIPTERQDRSTSTKVGNILNDLGFKKTKKTENGGRFYFYSPPVFIDKQQ